MSHQIQQNSYGQQVDQQKEGSYTTEVQKRHQEQKNKNWKENPDV